MAWNCRALSVFVFICLLLNAGASTIKDVVEGGDDALDTVVSNIPDSNDGFTSVLELSERNDEGLVSRTVTDEFSVMTTASNSLMDESNEKPTSSQNATRLAVVFGKDRNGSEKDEFSDYDYDIEESLKYYKWSELLPTLAVYLLTMVIGITGNALIIFTICRYRKMKSTTNVFLASLASADLLLITICIPVKLAKLFSFTWTFGFFLCKMVHYMQSVSAICSVLTLTAMSIERYYAIVHPMRAKYICTISQARRIILGTWAASFLLAVPILFAQAHLPVGRFGNDFYCVKDFDDPFIWRFHEVYMLLLILVIPTVVMAVTYTSICWEIFRVMQRRQDMTSGQGLKPASSCRGTEHIPLRYSKRISRTPSSNNHPNNHHPSLRESLKKVNNVRSEEENNTVKQVIKMLVAVVVLFVICWAPMLIENVLMAYLVVPAMRTEWTRHLTTAFHLMAYFNSCINPLVYGFMSKNFRESFSKALCRCCHRGRLPKRAMSMSQTRTTSVRFNRNLSMSRTSTQAEY